MIPKDAWVALNELHGLIERQSFASFDRSSRIRLLKQVISGSRLWHGCLMASQARDLSWLFMRLGDRLEHADMVSRLVDPRVTQMAPGASARWSSYEAVGWQNLLSAWAVLSSIVTALVTECSGVMCLILFYVTRISPNR